MFMQEGEKKREKREKEEEKKGKRERILKISPAGAPFTQSHI